MSKQNFKFLIACLLYLSICAGFAFGQKNPNQKPSEVTSWKKGTDQINPTLIDVNFRSDEFTYDVLTADGKRRLQLNIRKQYISTINKRRYQCAVISLREVLPSTIPGGYDLGLNMLYNGDAITTFTNFVCPVNSPSVFERNIYPFKSDRVFNIENFVLKITPIDFEYNSDYNLLSNLKLTVEFFNNPESSKVNR